MLARKVLFAILGCTALSLSACASESSGGDESVAGDENEVKVDTRTPAARRQYDANVAFATSYKAHCAAPRPATGHPRVLLTGFGRFMSIGDNATGRIISTVIPDGALSGDDAAGVRRGRSAGSAAQRRVRHHRASRRRARRRLRDDPPRLLGPRGHPHREGDGGVRSVPSS